MQKAPLIILLLAVLALFTGCATTYDLPEKYAGVIGKQYRTLQDGYIYRLEKHQFEFTPYELSSSGNKRDRLERIPAGTTITVKAAKRSYRGGDWDYIIGEVQAPGSNKVYEFEVLLGFSSFFPGDVARRWDPVDKEHTPAPLPDKGEYFTAPNAHFSIDKNAFPRPTSMYTVTTSQNPGSINFTLRDKGLVRIDHCTAPQKHLPDWAAKSTANNSADRTLDGVVAFVGAKTSGLHEFKLLSRRTNADLGGDQSAAVYRLDLSHGEYAGISYRGFLVFAHGSDSFVLHYQTAEPFSDDRAAGEAMLAQLLKLKNAMIFHSSE